MNAIASLEQLSPRDDTVVDELVQWLRRVLPADAALCCDSRAVRPGDAFFGWPGTHSDGRLYRQDAVARGAVALLEEALDPAQPGALAPESIDSVALRQVVGLQALAGQIARRYYGGAADRLKVVAVTGTNGKTTCTQWIAQGLSHLGHDCGVVGTLGSGMSGGVLQPFGLTMPDVLSLHRILAGLERAGARAVAMEATSIGLAQGRMDGVQPSVAVLTNLTRDHLDYHGTFEAYARAKLRLFEQDGLAHAVLNAAESLSVEAAAAVGPNCSIIAYGESSASFQHPACRYLLAERITEREDGLQLMLGGDFGRAEIFLPFPGRFNALNALACAGSWLALGHDPDRVFEAMGLLEPVAGRLQRFDVRGAPLAVVDYAHTPDALRQALAALRPVAQARGGQLVCVFGAGGERDRGKRPQMGALVEECADRVVLTSDNPRSEPPESILAEIAAGMSGRPALVEVDRGRAIEWAILESAAADVVLIAGKGHEAWQELAGERRPFSDADCATRALTSRAALQTSVPPAQAGPRLTLRQVFDSLSIACLFGDGGEWVSSVVTDSRKIVPGCLFIALSGERFDGHDFIVQAYERGARAVIFEHWRAGIPVPAIQVTNSRRALGELAAGWRRRFDLPLVAVTGSNGKTTVKAMLASIFQAAVGPDAMLASPGNENNEIGVPMTLLALRAEHRLAVLEMGMNHPGEIAWLASITRPNVALVNNAQREHQEFIAGTEASARENGSVFGAMALGGVAVFPADDPVHTPIWRAQSEGHPVIEFGLVPSFDSSTHALRVCALSEARPENFQIEIDGRRHALRLAIAGAHNVRNALAAAACALAAGVSPPVIVAGLERFKPVAGRLAERRGLAGSRVIDDTYNANPDSVRAAIDVLADTGAGAATLLVLGDMGEVGEQGPIWHAEVGAYARSRGLGALLGLGVASLEAVQAFGRGGAHFSDHTSLIEAARGLIHENSVVLVKGSRFMKMERVVDALTLAESD